MRVGGLIVVVVVVAVGEIFAGKDMGIEEGIEIGRELLFAMRAGAGKVFS